MRRGFTLIELATTLLAAVVIGVIAFAAIVVLSRSRATARGVSDGAYLRDMTTAFASWANNHGGDYPLPSCLDVESTTVPEIGRSKDTTANLYSMLIWNKLLSPERLISDMEVNPAIARDRDYQYRAPKKAVNPQRAHWDPAFSADFTNGMVGNLSFAHLQPSGALKSDTADASGRLVHWTDTSSSIRALFANRGPEIESIPAVGRIKSKNPDSYTHQILGARSRWEGCVAFSDGGVEYMTKLSSEDLAVRPLYTSPSGPRLDTLFFDEPDDVNQSNIYLGIFITAGEKPSEFKGIWD